MPRGVARKGGEQRQQQQRGDAQTCWSQGSSPCAAYISRAGVLPGARAAEALADPEIADGFSGRPPSVRVLYIAHIQIRALGAVEKPHQRRGVEIFAARVLVHAN